MCPVRQSRAGHPPALLPPVTPTAPTPPPPWAAAGARGCAAGRPRRAITCGRRNAAGVRGGCATARWQRPARPSATGGRLRQPGGAGAPRCPNGGGRGQKGPAAGGSGAAPRPERSGGGRVPGRARELRSAASACSAAAAPGGGAE